MEWPLQYATVSSGGQGKENRWYPDSIARNTLNYILELAVLEHDLHAMAKELQHK